MKPTLQLVIVLSVIFFAGASRAVVPVDFNPALASGSSDDPGQSPNFVDTYQNKIGISVVQDVSKRDDDVKVADQKPSPEIAAKFAGLSGEALVKAAEAAAKADPENAAQIAAAAIQRNMAAGGTPDTDLAIPSAILLAVGSKLPVAQVAALIGFGSERVPKENVRDSISGLRQDYIESLPPRYASFLHVGP